MVQAALTTFVLFSPERQATPLKIATAFAILLLPYSIFGPFIGVLIDRWPRQRILLFASLARSLSVLLIWLVVSSGNDGALLGVAVLVSLGIGRFIQATLSASLPHVARDSELVTANAFAPTAGTIASAIGGLGGVGNAQLIGTSVTYATLALATSLQLMAAWTASQMDRADLGPDSIVRGLKEQLFAVARELTDGWRQLASHRSASRALAVVVLHRSAFGMVTVTAIMLMRKAMNPVSETGSALGELAITVGGAAVGAFIGAALAPVLASRWGIPRLTAAALVVGGFGTAGFLALVITIPKSSAAIALMVLAGCFIGWVGQTVKVCADSIVQLAIADDHRGRVFAIYDMAVNVGLVSGILLAALCLPSDGRTLLAPAYALAILLSALLLLSPPRK